MSRWTWICSPWTTLISKKEGILLNYARDDGHAPIATYPSLEDDVLALELREGKHHCAKAAEQTLERIHPRSMALTTAPIVLRMDSGFDSHGLYWIGLARGQRLAGNGPMRASPARQQSVAGPATR